MNFLIKVLFCSFTYSQDTNAIWQDFMADESPENSIDSVSKLKERLEDCQDTSTFNNINKKIVEEIIQNFLDDKLVEIIDDIMDTCVLQKWVSLLTKENVEGLIDIYNDRLPAMKERLGSIQGVVSLGKVTGLLSFNFIKQFLSQTARIKKGLETFESVYWTYLAEVIDKKGLQDKEPFKTIIALVERILKEMKSSLDNPSQFSKDLERILLDLVSNPDPLIKKVADIIIDFKFPDSGLHPWIQKLVDYHKKVSAMDFEAVEGEEEEEEEEQEREGEEQEREGQGEVEGNRLNNNSPAAPFSKSPVSSYIFSISFILTL